MIVKSLAGLEAAAWMDMLCCDKTGTLTRNRLELLVRRQPQWTCLRPPAPADRVA